MVAGTKDAILMVESEAHELSEEVMLGAIMFGHEMMKNVIKGINELASEAGKMRWEWAAAPVDTALMQRIDEMMKHEVASPILLKTSSSVISV